MTVANQLCDKTVLHKSPTLTQIIISSTDCSHSMCVFHFLTKWGSRNEFHNPHARAEHQQTVFISRLLNRYQFMQLIITQLSNTLFDYLRTTPSVHVKCDHFLYLSVQQKCAHSLYRHNHFITTLQSSLNYSNCHCILPTKFTLFINEFHITQQYPLLYLFFS